MYLEKVQDSSSVWLQVRSLTGKCGMYSRDSSSVLLQVNIMTVDVKCTLEKVQDSSSGLLQNKWYNTSSTCPGKGYPSSV